MIKVVICSCLKPLTGGEKGAVTNVTPDGTQRSFGTDRQTDGFFLSKHVRESDAHKLSHHCASYIYETSDDAIV